jgi:hypothetical protein
MSENTEALIRAAVSFMTKHEFEKYMPVRLKKEFGKDNEAIFMYWLPNSFGGDNNSPIHIDNFMIADCVVMVMVGDNPQPSLADSRFLEPVIEKDEMQLQLEL